MDTALVHQLEHSKHLKTLFWTSLLIILVIELILFRLAFSNYSEIGLAQSLWAFLLSSTLPLGILARLLLQVRPIVFAVYNLYPSQLNVTSGSKHMVIKFEDLYSVKFGVGWSRFFQGYQLNHQSGQSIRIFSTLSKSDEILEQIIKLRPQFLSQEQLKKYRRQIQLNKISWQRLWELKGRFRTLTFNLVCIPLLVSGVTWFTGDPTGWIGIEFKWIDWLFGLFLTGFMISILLNSIEEKILHLLYSRQVLNEDFKRNLSLEKNLRVTFIILYWLLSLTLLIFLSQKE